MASDLPLFTGCPTFLRFPHCEDVAMSSARALILGAPFDLATTGRSGTRSGPAGIRQASANLAWEETLSCRSWKKVVVVVPAFAEGQEGD